MSPNSHCVLFIWTGPSPAVATVHGLVLASTSVVGIHGKLVCLVQVSYIYEVWNMNDETIALATEGKCIAR